jgi:plastocyanin
MLSLLATALVFAPADLSGVVTLSNGKPARQAVVYLEGAVKSKPLKKAVIDQRDRTFIPHVSVVTVGTKVDFPNNDVVFHNVFTEYHSEKFDFGMYARGKTKSQVFDRPGLAVLLCSIHPEMGAYVMCVDTPYYAITDSKGRFSIKDVV